MLLQTAAGLARIEGESTGACLYESALVGGTQALDREIGSLSAGYRADLVVLDLQHPDLAAVAGDRWLDAYIFVAGKSAIDSVFVGGERVVEKGRHRARAAIMARYARTMARLLAA